jgi:hypothetical protein
VASQVEAAPVPHSKCGGISVELRAASRPLSRSIPAVPEVTRTPVSDQSKDVSTAILFARELELVAAPGQSERLQREIPLLLRKANASNDGFVGSMVLLSDQEARLVTVIIFWRGEVSAKQYDDLWLEGLLEPYVDRFSRARTFVSFVEGMRDRW